MRVQWLSNILVAVSVVLAVGCGGGGGNSKGNNNSKGSPDMSSKGDPNDPNNPSDPNDPNDPSDPNDPNDPSDPNDPLPPGEVGSACTQNSDCPGDAEALCITEADYGWPSGYCAITNCSESNPCPSGSECYTLQDDSTLCLKTCTDKSDCGPGYACPSYGACTPACTADSCDAGEVCGASGECEPAPCTSTSCPDGTLCADNGKCVADLTGGPGDGPGPTCTGLPERDCTGTESVCGALTQFDPHQGTGYDDYPINGESSAVQYRSWARADLAQLIKYATAVVACKAADWTTGNGGALGLGDMSDKFGDTPGVHDINDKVVNMPGHPEGTHEDGRDMDIAYYQAGTSNNYLREVCPHTTSGKEQYHCTGTPDKLDVWRTALFLGTLMEFDRVRVIGVDGKVGALVEDAAGVLCAAGWMPQKNCDRMAQKLAYEETDMGYGWFLFHHHHLHISINPKSTSGGTAFKSCLDGGCRPKMSIDLSLLKQDKRLARTHLAHPTTHGLSIQTR